ncbi:arylsulfatase [Catalinimonas sp. 4WD22]
MKLAESSLWQMLSVAILALIFFVSCQEEEQVAERPNIIVILADDMGYSDLGCMGSEIATPNLDALAKEGLLFSNFYNTSRCCPSRASLLTGLYQHRAGVGAMNHDLGTPTYQGYLNDKCVTIAEVLKENGYHTIMSGKWHVGDERSQWPDKRGFQDFYGIPKGGGLYFYPSEFIDRPIFRNNEQVFPDPESFYTTDNFTDEAIQFIKNGEEKDKPFFLYLAYIAPHFPLQAWPEDIAKYEGVYEKGYETIRQQRFARQKELGIVPAELVLSPSDFQSWDSLENKSEEARKMAVYAAQVDRMDQNIGKLIQALKEEGKMDNTLILFLSDNGACAEEVNRSPKVEVGGADSFVAYGQNWANVSNTPYRLYKSMTHEGGIRTPLIAHWPDGIKSSGQIIGQLAHINDILPTCLAVAGAEYPATYEGREILAYDGRSFAGIFAWENDSEKSKTSSEEVLYWEHIGNQAIREEDWKLVKRGKQDWELYDLSQDPTELNNLSLAYPEKAFNLEIRWQSWADSVGVMERSK